MPSCHKFLGGCWESLKPPQGSLNHLMNFASDTNWCSGTRRFLQEVQNYVTKGVTVNMDFNIGECRVVFLGDED